MFNDFTAEETANSKRVTLFKMNLKLLSEGKSQAGAVLKGARGTGLGW